MTRQMPRASRSGFAAWGRRPHESGDDARGVDAVRATAHGSRSEDDCTPPQPAGTPQDDGARAAHRGTGKAMIRMLSADDKLAEIKRLYYQTNRATIKADFAKA